MAALHQNRQGSVNHGEEFGFYSERPGKPEEGREESHAFIYIKKKKNHSGRYNVHLGGGRVIT